MDHILNHELVKKWQQNHDEDAATKLYKNVNRFMFYLLNTKFNNVKNIVDGESLADEVFYIAINKFDLDKVKKSGGKLHFVGFLEKCFRNKIISQSKCFINRMDRIDNFDISDKSDFILSIINNEQQIKFKSCLEDYRKKNEKRAKILELKCDGMSNVEISKKFGVTPQAINDSLNRSIVDLRKILSEV